MDPRHQLRAEGRMLSLLRREHGAGSRDHRLIKKLVGLLLGVFRYKIVQGFGYEFPVAETAADLYTTIVQSPSARRHPEGAFLLLTCEGIRTTA